MPYVTETWHGCYDLTWHGAIVPAAFAHPAKMSRGLLRRILAELKARGVAPGALVVDPFGGIGSTGIEGAYAWYRVVCCELEPKFVALARENFAFHAQALEVLERPAPVVVEGDSRHLRAYVDAALADALVSSPPYAVIASGSGGLNTLPAGPGQQGGRSPSSASQDTDSRYGTGAGQLARLPAGDVDAIVCSPPYSTGDTSSAQSITERSDPSASWVKANTGSACTQGYGRTDGQLGVMPQPTFWSAALDVVVESFEILKPGGYAAWVVKAFVKDKQVVDFPDDWRRLCESVGFETLVEARASLVKESTYETLFGDVETTRRERKSFFRRLAEAKGSPRIDWETVWMMRKPEVA